MTIHELQAILDRHDPTADVVISTKHNRACFYFRVEERVGSAITKGQPLVPLKMTDEVGLTVVSVRVK
jgi:hypothetical protein